jgi:hypothetical protein
MMVQAEDEQAKDVAQAEALVLWAAVDENRKPRRGRRRAGVDRNVRTPMAPHRVTAKRLGEMAEASFLAKASGLGFGVAKPWGDSDRYDFIVDVSGDVCRRLWRVQVKSAHRAGEDGGYSFHMHGHSLEPYRKDEIDFLVAYVVPENAWYVFPMSEAEKHRSLKLYPGSQRKRSKFEKYREAWAMLER